MCVCTPQENWHDRLEQKHQLKMYLLLKIRWFSNVMLVVQCHFPNNSHLKRDYFNRKYIWTYLNQPSIFRWRNVSFREGNHFQLVDPYQPWTPTSQEGVLTLRGSCWVWANIGFFRTVTLLVSLSRWKSIWVFPKIWENPPKSSILIGFSIIFTIHFGVFPPIFGNTYI